MSFTTSVTLPLLLPLPASALGWEWQVRQLTNLIVTFMVTLPSPSSFHSFLETHQTPILVLFGAEWCAPCKRLKLVLEGAEPTLQGKVTMVHLDAEEMPSVFQEEGIRSLPTLVLYSQGIEVIRKTGLLTTQQVLSLLNNEE